MAEIGAQLGDGFVPWLGGFVIGEGYRLFPEGWASVVARRVA